MRRRLYIPNEVADNIALHVRNRMTEALERFDAGAEDEDTFTGHLGALLGCAERSVGVDGRSWKWRLEYTKFRGRGTAATEKLIGADGILEARVLGPEVSGYKAVLFQAKMGVPSGGDLLRQAIQLTTWREAAVVFGYERERVSVLTIDEVLRSSAEGKRILGRPLDDFILRTFLGCRHGDSDLAYNPKPRVLQWRNSDGRLVASSFAVKSRLRLTVKSPQSSRPPYELIPSTEIHEHRMDSRAEERLGLPDQFNERDLKRALRENVRALHPDRFHGLEEPFRITLNTRSREVNEAHEEIRQQHRFRK